MKPCLAWLALLALLVSCTAEEVSVVVVTGPTAIPRGDAISANDITVSNGLFAVAFAVDSAPPWGVARGGIVDIGILRDGQADFDIASLADFMPNNWSSWPTTYQRVSIEKQSAAEVVILTERDWGDVALATRFTIRGGDSRIRIVTTMTNAGDTALEDLLSGYVVWPDGGSLIADPVKFGSSDAHGWTAAYDSSWVIGLHAPFSEVSDRLGRDRYTRHTLPVGASKSFEAWLQIENDGSLDAMIETEIDHDDLAAGELHGNVTSSDGAAIDRPAVVIARNGMPLAWAIGNGGSYRLRLPAGEYELYATAGGYGPGTTERVTVVQDSVSELNFDDVKLPGKIAIRATADGQAVDARVRIAQGQKPFIAFYGKDVFFTELAGKGELSQIIAPGSYAFELSAGGGFTTLPQRIDVEVQSGETAMLEVDIPVLASPGAEGWYSADLHHHSDVLDGFTEAEYVLRSELAAGVDVTFLSDHDSVINNEAMRRMSEARGIPFIPATELSPSWGHFNAYPLDAGKTVDIDTGQAEVGEIFQEARRLGADVVAVNHPYSEYGYFTSHEKGVVPGDYDAGFDLLEIGPVTEPSGQRVKNEETLQRAWQFWNDGIKAYLVGGSDVHDVWSFESARARTFVHVEGELNNDKFVAALLAGRAYASQGPLVFPEIHFGSTIAAAAGEEISLQYEVQAVTGLQSVTLVESGRPLAEKRLSGERERLPLGFLVRPLQDTWYSLVVRDIGGKIAYTNPVWVTIAGRAGE